jgi:hypothetical protein
LPPLPADGLSDTAGDELPPLPEGLPVGGPAVEDGVLAGPVVLAGGSEPSVLVAVLPGAIVVGVVLFWAATSDPLSACSPQLNDAAAKHNHAQGRARICMRARLRARRRAVGAAMPPRGRGVSIRMP